MFNPRMYETSGANCGRDLNEYKPLITPHQLWDVASYFTPLRLTKYLAISHTDSRNG